MSMDPRVMALMQGAGGGGGVPPGGGGGMPPGMPGGGGGGGLQSLMAMAGPLLQGMGPNAKMQLGAALQTPGVQQMVGQILSNPQMMQQILAMATQGGGGMPAGGMPPGIGGQGMPQRPVTDQEVEQVGDANAQVPGGNNPSTEEELEMLQQMMNKGGRDDQPSANKSKKY